MVLKGLERGENRHCPVIFERGTLSVRGDTCFIQVLVVRIGPQRGTRYQKSGVRERISGGTGLVGAVFPGSNQPEGLGNVSFKNIELDAIRVSQNTRAHPVRLSNLNLVRGRRDPAHSNPSPSTRLASLLHAYFALGTASPRISLIARKWCETEVF